jgi:hypothetical protein
MKESPKDSIQTRVTKKRPLWQRVNSRVNAINVANMGTNQPIAATKAKGKKIQEANLTETTSTVRSTVTVKLITGYIVYLLSVPICWQSKSQRSVSLSSSEAEFISLSEGAIETKFIVQVLITMGIDVKLPVIVHVDNVGAIFMAENVTTIGHTKHRIFSTNSCNHVTFVVL